MKKILAVIMTILMMMLFAGCNRERNVQIIGGADGPTGIYITESEE